MCALFPPFYPNFGWPVENNLTLQEQCQIFGGSENLETFPAAKPQAQSDQSPSSATNQSDLAMAKKLNHNASERSRRKKMNSLYATLRSLLPALDQSKKLSIPATVSRVLKYIPELQDQISKLVRKKEELLLRVSRHSDARSEEKEKKTKKAVTSLLSSVSATKLTDTEFMVQISSTAVHQNKISDVVAGSEEEGLYLMNASYFVSPGGRVFHNLHFEVERAREMDCEALSERLLCLYERDEESLR